MEISKNRISLDDLISKVIKEDEYEKLIKTLNHNKDLIAELANKASIEKYLLLKNQLTLSAAEKLEYDKILKIKESNSYESLIKKMKIEAKGKSNVDRFIVILLGIILLIMSITIGFNIFMFLGFCICALLMYATKFIDDSIIEHNALIALLNKNIRIPVTLMKLNLKISEGLAKNEDELKDMIYKIISTNTDKVLSNSEIAYLLMER